MTLNGSIRALLLFDVGEEIDLQQLRTTLGAGPGKREPAFRLPSPEYVRYEQPPVVDTLRSCEPFEGLAIGCQIRYFNYGVASVELRTNFSNVEWAGVIDMANHWVLSPELEKRASAILHTRIDTARPALKKPYENWISEDYYVIQIDPIKLDDGATLSAEELTRRYGMEIAQIVRGEETPLSPNERQEVLASSMSYYPHDLLVLGWVAAFVYDNPIGAAATVDLLDYANTQLLEFRYYDEVLTRVLTDVYKRLDKRRGIWGQWSFGPPCRRTQHDPPRLPRTCRTYRQRH